MRYPSTHSTPMVTAQAAAMAVFVLGACRLAGAGEIYCDNQGRDCSDRPSPTSVAVHIANPPPSAASEPAPAPGNATRPPIDANANAQLKDAATRQAVDKDIASKRAEDCKQARQKYEQAITAHRMYKEGKNGEREYLSDTELDQARFNARQQMDRSCGTSGN
jgi:hypothetical protein